MFPPGLIRTRLIPLFHLVMAKKSETSGVIKFIVIVVILAIAIGGYYYWQQRADRTPTYTTTTVARGDVVQVVTASGQLQPVLQVDVSSRVSGNISEIDADFNSAVTKGEVVAKIADDTYKAAVSQAQASLLNAQANLTLQKLNAAREETLFKQGLVAKSDYDSAIALLQQAQAMVQIQEASLSNAEANLSYCIIYSPLDGTVISRNVDVGNTVAASFSAPVLFTIANDLHKMQILTSVSEADIGNVADGQKVTFTVDAYPNRTFHGIVSQIRNAPITVQNVVTYNVVVSVANADLKLMPGMTANVSIVVASRTNALKIANSALRVRLPAELMPPAPAAAPGSPETAAPPPSGQMSDADRAAMRAKFAAMSPEEREKFREQRRGDHSGGVTTRTLYILPGGDLKARPVAASVKLGITDGTTTEVISGLKEGDVVITGAFFPDDNSAVSRSPFGSPFGRR